ncbi:uncharacterized protein A1O5_10341 [Cladophialophora psammophila CBS 110553]|uniref:Cytochrome P450 oxidoreductase n=1 Tax=Cladophialophora psammophila CBS 110553 TaxID=1182543 RepID=W9WNT9_9EURO|nr:uncharacterized protein A1O5_10341 [Cladophialophora psammophila CBS 110553]EXJ66670.1 hypothetical protein A1O5_10341 [Cladophialophora psammophila CBS 110553]
MALTRLVNLVDEPLKAALYALLLLILGYPALVITYNLLFHSLRKVPGPKLWAATLLPAYYNRLRGTAVFRIKELHDQYGPVVRVAPEELSFIDGQAWKDIYGYNTANTVAFERDALQAGPEEAGTPGLLRSKGEQHNRLRRTLNHAFSDKALKQQEGLIKNYADMLIGVLNRRAELQKSDPDRPDAQINMVEMYHFTTFDAMADLSFGQPLGLLKQRYTAWVSFLLSHVKSVAYMHAIARWPILARSVKYLLPKSVKEGREEFFGYCVAKVEERMAVQTERPDFWSLIVKNQDEKGITRQEMYAVASDFMVAGTETTATLLSGATWYLCTYPDKMKKLCDEIRSFGSADELTLQSLQNTVYLQAVLQESLRVYPAVPAGGMRLVPKEGYTICGEYYPGYSGPFASGRVTCSVMPYVANHSAYNFHNPDAFVPERFVPDPPAEYRDDKKGAFKPFGHGPRVCIGENLAWHNARLILAYVIYHFDISLVDEKDVWVDQPIMELWMKKPLLVKLSPVQR